MPQDLLASLNPQQLAAVTAPEESILILAGAGSGKTRVLTTRIAWLLEQQLARTGEILAVTFTNKAAKEMVTRLEALLPWDLRHMWIGTFHGLCNRILRRHADYAALPRTFQILDSADQLALVKRVMREANVDPEKTDPKYVANFINWCKEHGMRSGSVGKDAAAPDVIDLYRAYEGQCQREGVVDFAELLLRCYELLERNEIVRTHYQHRFRHILVDEFQDTNILQYRWLRLLAGQGLGPDGKSLNAVFAVGDDDQSIYAFRGANVGNMQDFLADFKVAQPIRLEQNYRSTGTILDAANGLISQNAGRLGKNLWTSGARGDKIVVKELEDDRDEAQWVVDQVKAERGRGHPYSDFAVLYRTNAQSRAIEAALTSNGVPYRVYGGLRFFERAEVKNLLAYLRLITNPWDDTSFLRIVNFPARGIGAKTIEGLQAQAREAGKSLWGALCDPALRLPPKLYGFRTLIESIRHLVEAKTLPAAIEDVIRASGLAQAYDKDPAGEERVANMREVISAAQGYLANEGIDPNALAFALWSDEAPTPMEGFLTQATLEAGDKMAEETGDAVQLMTVHAAKGLEFPWVFIVGAEEGIFPHFSALKGDDKSKGGLDEERRLMYVAITRAKKHLVITHCAGRMMYGRSFENPISSFVEEIPAALLDMRPLGRRRGGDDDDGWGRRSGYGSGYGSSYGSGRGGHGGSYGGGYGGGRSGGYGSRSGSGSSYGSSYSRGGSKSAYGSSGHGSGSEKRGGRSSLSGLSSPLKASAANAASAAEAGVGPGDIVEHSACGRGKVLSVSGSGAGLRVKIKFKSGEKEFLWSIARDRTKVVEKAES